jgi:uncharacterized membrane protein YkoI
MRPGMKLVLAAIGALVLIVGARNLGTPTPAASNAAVPAAAAQAAKKQTGGESAPDKGKDDGVQLHGTPAERAGAAAKAAVPGARVNEIERTDSGSGYEVELIRPDGSVVDVVLDGSFNVIKVVR